MILDYFSEDMAGSAPSGQIQLGARKFFIVAVANQPAVPDRRELCRFALAGQILAVVEAGDSAGQAEIPAASEVSGRLSGREFEIAVLVAQGHGNKNIAHRLRISEWTVATYLRRIFLKLDVENRAAMVFRCASIINASLTTTLSEGADPARNTNGHRHAKSAAGVSRTTAWPALDRRRPN
jgi:DNA-binding CsgD family transcriptional regulator